MLRNLFVGTMNTDLNKRTLSSYIQTLRMEPSKIASMLAIFIVPVTALGWWCYSFVLSVGAMEPLQSAAGASSTISPSTSNIPSTSSLNINPTTSSLPFSPEPESTNAQVNDTSSQTTVKIDGQTVPIANPGTTHKVIHNDNGQTTVDVKIDSDTTGTTKSRSSTNINVRSSSSADVDIQSKESR